MTLPCPSLRMPMYPEHFHKLTTVINITSRSGARHPAQHSTPIRTRGVWSSPCFASPLFPIHQASARVPSISIDKHRVPRLCAETALARIREIGGLDLAEDGLDLLVWACLLKMAKWISALFAAKLRFLRVRSRTAGGLASPTWEATACPRARFRRVRMTSTQLLQRTMRGGQSDLIRLNRQQESLSKRST